MEDRNLKLMQLHDGELPEGEAERLRDSLSAEEKGRLEALDELGGLLHDSMMKEAEGVDLWAGISARLETPAQAADAAPAAGRAEGQVVPLAARRRRSVQLTALATTMLAMAAAFAFWLTPGGAHPSNRCEVEALEVAGSSATVLQIPGDHDDSTTVVWMDHQESDEWESL